MQETFTIKITDKKTNKPLRVFQTTVYNTLAKQKAVANQLQHVLKRDGLRESDVNTEVIVKQK